MAFRITRRTTAGTNRVDAFTNLADSFVNESRNGPISAARYASVMRQRNDLLLGGTDAEFAAIGQKYYGTSDVAELQRKIAEGDQAALGDAYATTAATTGIQAFSDFKDAWDQEVTRAGGIGKISKKRYGEVVGGRDQLLAGLRDEERASIGSRFYAGYDGDGSDLGSFISKSDLTNADQLMEDPAVDSDFETQQATARRRRLYGGLYGYRSLLSNGTTGSTSQMG